MAVVPEHGAKYDLRKYAAQVLVGSSNEKTAQEYPPVILFCQRQERNGQHNRSDPPHKAERAVKHTGPAHPCAADQPAPECFYQITKQRT